MKKNKWLIVLSFVIILFIGFRMMNNNKSDDPVSKTNYLMGTIVKLTIYDDIKDESVFEDTFKLIRNIENKMSLNIEDSETNKINKNAFNKRIPISEEMNFVLEKSLEYSKLSDGRFDVTVGSLVKLWGIGSESARVPSQSEIINAISHTGYKYMDLNKDGVSLNKSDMLIDLGAIAKGYAADQVADYLDSQNINRAIIDIGGNIYVLGSKAPETPWTVSIQNPFNETRGDFLGTVRVSNKSVVTSGVYERYLEKEGKKYHHILDPFTGYPVENELMSVTIISDKSIDGDALSTAVFSLGLEKGYELVKSLDGVDAIFVTKDKSVYLTPNAKNIFNLKNTDFKISYL